MRKPEMTIRQVETNREMTIGEVARAAEELIREGYPDPILVASFDRKNYRAGPMEACDRQPYKVTVDYAFSNEADTCLRVDGREYELFFRRTPPDVNTLDREMCLEIHRDLPENLYDNIMGG